MTGKRKYWLLLPVGLIAIYLAGPSVKGPQLSRELPEIPGKLEELESWIAYREDTTPMVKPDNEARIIWADSARKTKYSLVYLHGWSASQAEGAPLHTELARRYGMNLYLPRLYGHGLEEEWAMKDLTAEKLLLSAREAIAVAREIGDSILFFGTSTGGTLSLYMAPAVPELAAIILYSPNIRIYESTAALLDDPWGYQIARIVSGSEYHYWEIEPERAPYWSNKYPLKALTHLQALVTATMTQENFENVRVPVFMGYYYKNDSLQDHTVSVPAMLEMFDELGTPPGKKVKQAFPEAGAHVIGSYLVSEDLPSVRSATIQFLEGIVGLRPVDSVSSLSGTNQSE